MSLNSVRGYAAHSALLLCDSGSYFCTPLYTLAAEATDLIAANHTFHTQAAASDDRYLCYVTVLSKPSKSTLTHCAVCSSITHIYASCNKMCVFVCSVRVLRIILVGNVARIGENRNMYMVLMEKHEGNWLLRRPKRRWLIILK